MRLGSATTASRSACRRLTLVRNGRGVWPHLTGGAWYDIGVTKTFKGKPSLRLRLFSENSTARFWLNKGERYLFFVTEEPFDAPIGRALTADTCGNSARVNRALLQKVQSLAPGH